MVVFQDSKVFKPQLGRFLEQQGFEQQPQLGRSLEQRGFEQQHELSRLERQSFVDQFAWLGREREGEQGDDTSLDSGWQLVGHQHGHDVFAAQEHGHGRMVGFQHGHVRFSEPDSEHEQQAQEHGHVFPQHVVEQVSLLGSASFDLSDQRAWLVDSGASSHLIGETLLEGGHVRILEESRVNVQCSLASGDPMTLTRKVKLLVMFVTSDCSVAHACLTSLVCNSASHAILSTGALARKGWQVSINSDGVTVQQGSLSLGVILFGNVGWVFSAPAHGRDNGYGQWHGRARLGSRRGNTSKASHHAASEQQRGARATPDVLTYVDYADSQGSERRGGVAADSSDGDTGRDRLERVDPWASGQRDGEGLGAEAHQDQGEATAASDAGTVGVVDGRSGYQKDRHERVGPSSGLEAPPDGARPACTSLSATDEREKFEIVEPCSSSTTSTSTAAGRAAEGKKR